MAVSADGIVTLVMPVQPWNVEVLSVVIPLGIMISFRPVQFAKAYDPIPVSDVGRSISVIPEQPSKAYILMLVSVEGKDTVFNAAALRNAYAGSAVIPSGTVTLVS